MTRSSTPDNNRTESKDSVEYNEEIETSQEIIYLRKKVQDLRDEQKLLISSLHDKKTNFSVESYLISNINIFTNDYSLDNQDLLDVLSKLSPEELDNFIKVNKKNYDQYSDEDYVKDLFLYHYINARKIYEKVFKYFENLSDEPERFWADLIWMLDIGFNLELFVCTQKIQNCRGFIFNLESGFGYKDRMGMVLTPLAFKSSKVFLNTLFHELAHRVYYIELDNGGITEIDTVQHEWRAYFQDKFLQNLVSVELRWLDEILEEDIFKTAEEISESFLSEIFESSMKDIEEIYNIMQKIDEAEALYSCKKLKKKYYKAIKLIEIPRNYSCVTDFIYFFNEKVLSLYRNDAIELEMSNWVILMLLIIYSRKYEKKYHTPNSMVYNNIIFSPVGEIDEIGVLNLNRYASTLMRGYENT